GVIFVLDVLSAKLSQLFSEFPLKVYQRDQVVILILNQQWRHFRHGLFGYQCIIGTKGRGGMNDPGTIFSGNEISANNSEGIFRILIRKGIRQQMLIADAYEVFSEETFRNEIRDLVSLLECFQGFLILQLFELLVELLLHQVLCQDDVDGLKSILIIGLYQTVFYFRSYRKGRVGRQGPGGGGPGDEANILIEGGQRIWQRIPLCLEHGGNRGVG